MSQRNQVRLRRASAPADCLARIRATHIKASRYGFRGCWECAFAEPDHMRSDDTLPPKPGKSRASGKPSFDPRLKRLRRCARSNLLAFDQDLSLPIETKNRESVRLPAGTCSPRCNQP